MPKVVDSMVLGNNIASSRRLFYAYCRMILVPHPMNQMRKRLGAPCTDYNFLFFFPTDWVKKEEMYLPHMVVDEYKVDFTKKDWVYFKNVSAESEEKHRVITEKSFIAGVSNISSVFSLIKYCAFVNCQQCFTDVFVINKCEL